MNISLMLNIIGWCFFASSLFFRTRYALKLTKDSEKARLTSINLNIVSILFFIVAILMLTAFSKYDIIIQ